MNWLLEKIRVFGDKKAIIHEDTIYTYKELFEAITRYKEQIDFSIQRGDVVAIVSDYSFACIALFLSLIENRNIIVPIATTVESEIAERLLESHADKKATLCGDQLKIDKTGNAGEKHYLIKQLKNKESAGLILFSSGTTGKPKAMIHNLNTLIDTYQNKKTRTLTFLLFLMFDHIGGLNTLFNALSMGVTIAIPSKRAPEDICDFIEKYKINVLPASPTFLNLILMSEAYKNKDLSSIMMITYGTEQMPENLLVRLKEAFPRIKFLQTFGTSETGIVQATSKTSSSTYMKIDDPNIEYKIFDGELWLRSKTQVLGYLNYSMERFTEDGWFKTGDLVETTEDGYIKIIGRNSEIINVGGQKVLPAEVESVLLQMPEIADCMVYGGENPIMGQIGVVDVVLAEEMPAQEIKRRILMFCRDKLDRYKIPVKVNVVSRINFSDRFKKIRK